MGLVYSPEQSHETTDVQLVSPTGDVHEIDTIAVNGVRLKGTTRTNWTTKVYTIEDLKAAGFTVTTDHDNIDLTLDDLPAVV